MYEDVKRNFLLPDSAYSLAPFWFWNDSLSQTEITRQLTEFKAKGVDLLVLHPRIGIPKELEYLSESFMGYVKYAVETAAALSMQIILYDEGMYPSGSAHGLVVRNNPSFASRGLRMAEGEAVLEDGDVLIARAAVRGGVYTFIEGYTKGTIRGIHFGEDDGEAAAPRSADILNPAAVQAYIQLTHDRYYQVCKEHFGKTIIAMFTDEPCIMGREPDKRMKPWTGGFLEYYQQYGGRIEDLPHLWLDIDETSEAIRNKYKRAYTKRLGEVFFRPISEWCESHSIALCGHPGESDEIALLQYFQIPGQDLIFRRVAPENNSAIEGIESVQAKCGADAARHYGRRRNLNECFACGGRYGEWSFNTDDMKWMMDWLFVRGVNMLTPHAFFYSMRGERRNERPPDVGPNNLWWPYYEQFALYAKRMSYMMTDCVNQARVAVLCGQWGLPYKSVKHLYEHQIEFNYLEDSLIPQCGIKNGALTIRQQRYTHILIEDKSLVTADIKRRLDEFADSGGHIEYQACTAEPDVILRPHAPHLRVSQIVKNGLRFFVLHNEGEEPIAGRLRLRNAWTAERWDAWSGTITPAQLDAFFLERRETAILCVREEAVGCGVHNWTIDGAPSPLGDWCVSDISYSGSKTYSAEITAPKQGMAELELGEVLHMAEVRVNKTPIGVRMWPPFSFLIPLQKGRNTLDIIITNTLANRWGEAIPSGLRGPVTVRMQPGPIR